MSKSGFQLFQVFGVELEYMIVDAATLDVRPITDRVIHDMVGKYVSEIEVGQLAWSNELALHVIELKTNGPADKLAGLADVFQADVQRINQLLARHQARLMPTAMHPWMDPHQELQLWPHEFNPVYEAFHRIFDCRGHGWANLQSVHLNLPFADDLQFGRLHAAIRLLLPLIPALAASSPIIDRHASGFMDSRLEVYRANARRLPSVSGDVIPEPVVRRKDYEQQILERIYRDVAPLDPDGTLQFEWLNARGAIARFDRNTIEIRVVDIQECPQADLAICQAITAALKALCEQRWSDYASQCQVESQRLIPILHATIRDAEQAVISDQALLALFGIEEPQVTAGRVWQHLIQQTMRGSSGDVEASCLHCLDTILEQGPLARRILHALQQDHGPQGLQSTYSELSSCLESGRMFGCG